MKGQEVKVDFRLSNYRSHDKLRVNPQTISIGDEVMQFVFGSVREHAEIVVDEKYFLRSAVFGLNRKNVAPGLVGPV